MKEFHAMSGPQFGLVVDFTRSGWSDGVFQEFVKQWKSGYASPTSKAVAAYVFDRTRPIPTSHVIKTYISDKVKRRLKCQRMVIADVK
jgi:hypothetical protein